jgi:hypothetical protein
MATPKRATIPGSTFDSKSSRVIGKMTEITPNATDLGEEEVAAELGAPEAENSAATTTNSQPEADTVTTTTATPKSAPEGKVATNTSNKKTVIKSNSNTVLAQNGKADIKVTFYLTEAQVDKLDEMVFAYKKRRGKRINRNDIVRYLIDSLTSETVEQADIN